LSSCGGTFECLLAAGVDLLDKWVALDLVDFSFLQNFAHVENRDRSGELTDELHVVFRDDDRVFAGKSVKQFARPLALSTGHARDGLIEQQKFRFLDEKHRYFEPLAFAVRERRTQDVLAFEEPYSPECRENLITPDARQRHEETPQAIAESSRYLNVFEATETSKHRWGLELPPDAGFDYLVFTHLRQFEALKADFAMDLDCFGSGLARRVACVVEHHSPGLRPDLSGDDIHEGGFSGAIGTDEEAEFALAECDAEVIEHAKAIKRDDEVLDSECGISHL
jgi:hypothetical protein